MDREPDDHEVLTLLQQEVTRWQPRRVPNLVDLTGTVSRRQWARPVMLASGMGAAALALVLAAASALVLAHPMFPGSQDLVYRLVNP